MKLYELNNGLYHECADKLYYNTSAFDCSYRSIQNNYTCTACNIKIPSYIGLFYKIKYQAPLYLIQGDNISSTISHKFFLKTNYKIITI